MATTKRKPTPAQLRARALFAQRARSGELRKERAHHQASSRRRKTNPESVDIPVTRSTRKANFPWMVQVRNTENWNPHEAFKSKSEAMESARAVKDKYPRLPVRVVHFQGGPMSNPRAKGYMHSPAQSRAPTHYQVHKATHGVAGALIATFTKKADAVQYAQAYAQAHRVAVVIVGKGL